MNTALKWKLVVGFLLAFLAGGAAGGFFVTSHVRHRHADPAHSQHWLTERMRTRLQAELDLTRAQIEKTAPIFDRAARELDKIRAETAERVRRVIADTNRELAPELTDAQRAKLDAMKNRLHPNRKMRGAPPERAHHPPG